MDSMAWSQRSHVSSVSPCRRWRSAIQQRLAIASQANTVHIVGGAQPSNSDQPSPAKQTLCWEEPSNPRLNSSRGILLFLRRQHHMLIWQCRFLTKRSSRVSPGVRTWALTMSPNKLGITLTNLTFVLQISFKHEK
jgi:hypothetical protein